jgi:hypothetical protein
MKPSWCGFGLVLALAACTRAAPPTEPEVSPSPQAKAVPAQLTKIPTIASGAVASNIDAGPPPSPLRADVSVSTDALSSRDLIGYSLRAVLRAEGAPPSSKAPEVSQAGLDAARKRTEPRLEIDLSPLRARMVLAAGFLLPPDSELRARADRYGFFLVSPDASTYRTIAPGTLRALLGERRLDVAPLSPADLATRGEGPRRLGYRTRKVEIVTRAANATIEIARLADSGEGGALVCRALLDLVNAPPSSALCGAEDVPLHAELRWMTHGSLTFDVVSIARRTDLSPSQLAAPPPNARFLDTPPPPSPGEPMLSTAELAALHTQAIDVPVADGGAPGLGLALANASDEMRIAWIDGVPAAWVAPGGRITITGLLRGRYSIAWRTFLGDVVDAPETVTVPGTSRVGPEDGGL